MPFIFVFSTFQLFQILYSYCKYRYEYSTPYSTAAARADAWLLHLAALHCAAPQVRISYPWYVSVRSLRVGALVVLSIMAEH